MGGARPAASVNNPSSCLESKLLIFPKKQLQGGNSALRAACLWGKNRRGEKKIICFQSKLLRWIPLAYQEQQQQKRYIMRRHRIALLSWHWGVGTRKARVFILSPNHNCKKIPQTQSQFMSQNFAWLSASRILVSSRCCWRIKGLSCSFENKLTKNSIYFYI